MTKHRQDIWEDTSKFDNKNMYSTEDEENLVTSKPIAKVFTYDVNFPRLMLRTEFCSPIFNSPPIAPFQAEYKSCTPYLKIRYEKNQNLGEKH